MPRCGSARTFFAVPPCRASRRAASRRRRSRLRRHCIPSRAFLAARLPRRCAPSPDASLRTSVHATGTRRRHHAPHRCTMPRHRCRHSRLQLRRTTAHGHEHVRLHHGRHRCAPDDRVLSAPCATQCRGVPALPALPGWALTGSSSPSRPRSTPCGALVLTPDAAGCRVLQPLAPAQEWSKSTMIISQLIQLSALLSCRNRSAHFARSPRSGAYTNQCNTLDNARSHTSHSQAL